MQIPQGAGTRPSPPLGFGIPTVGREFPRVGDARCASTIIRGWLAFEDKDFTNCSLGWHPLCITGDMPEQKCVTRPASKRSRLEGGWTDRARSARCGFGIMYPRLPMRSARTGARWARLLLVFLLVGCHHSKRISLQSAGHAISVQVEGDHSIDAESGKAVIRTAYGSISIEPSRVTLDGAHWTRIPEGVPVRVGMFKHSQWIAAGSVTIRQSSSAN